MSRPSVEPVHRLASNIAWNALANYLGTAAALAVGFLLLPYIIRRLGNVQYGLWLLVAGLASFVPLLELGIGGSVVKAVAECRTRGAHEEMNRLVGAAFALFTVSGAVVLVTTAGVALGVEVLFTVRLEELGRLRALILVVGVTAALALPLSLFERMLAGFQRFDLINLAKAVSALLFAGFTVAVLEAGHGIVGLALAQAAGVVVGYLIQAYCVRVVDPAFRLGWRGVTRPEVVSIAHVSVFLFLIGLACFAIRVVDTFLVAGFLGLAAVAHYGIARKLRDLILTLIGPLGTVFFPLGAGLATGSPSSRSLEVAAGGTKACLAITTLLVVVLGVHAEPLLAFWVGPQYVLTVTPPLLILLAGILAPGAAWVAQEMLHSSGGHRMGAALLSAEAVGGALLAWLLLPRLGITGVALGVAVFATVVSSAAVVYYVRYFLGASLLTFVRAAILPPLGTALLTFLGAALGEWLWPSGSIPSLLVHMVGSTVLFLVVYLGLATTRSERRAMVEVAQSLLGGEGRAALPVEPRDS